MAIGRRRVCKADDSRGWGYPLASKYNFQKTRESVKAKGVKFWVSDTSNPALPGLPS